MYGYLRHLAHFARIVEAGSMRAASDLIGVAPSGLSDSVRILETRLKVPLLVRHKGGVTPTSEGERVYAAASGIIDQLDEVMGLETTRSLTGQCRFSVPTEVANTCFGSVLADLSAMHPRLHVSMYAEDEPVEFGRFGRDYFLRFSGREQTYQGYRSIWTGKAQAVLVASTRLVSDGQVNDLDYLATLPAILGAARKQPYDFKLINPTGRLTFERAIFASHPSARLSLATQGYGIAGCIDCCAAGAIADGKLRRILADRFAVPLTVSLLTPHQRARQLDEPVVEAVARAIEGSPLPAPPIA